ncbi:MAG: GNAT family N-acetyltransferase, partial [Chloroflexota bacterium]
MADGPRALRADEWDQLNEVVSTVFRPEMFHDYPQLFSEGNRQNLRVVADDGKVVCHVGMTQRPASLAGCRIDVACIGAVSALDAYRGRGFASQAFQDACDTAAAGGVDVMLISGGRGLYTRVGCRQVGQDWDFAVALENARPLAALGGASDVALAPAGPDQIDGLRALYQREPIRFIRPVEDWQMAFDCGIVMNTAADFWGVSRHDQVVGYLVVHQPGKVRRRNPDDPATVRVVEYAGDRNAIAAAIPRLLDHYGAGRASIHVQGADAALRALLTTAGGVEGIPA